MMATSCLTRVLRSLCWANSEATTAVDNVGCSNVWMCDLIMVGMSLVTAGLILVTTSRSARTSLAKATRRSRVHEACPECHTNGYQVLPGYSWHKPCQTCIKMRLDRVALWDMKPTVVCLRDIDGSTSNTLE